MVPRLNAPEKGCVFLCSKMYWGIYMKNYSFSDCNNHNVISIERFMKSYLGISYDRDYVNQHISKGKRHKQSKLFHSSLQKLNLSFLYSIPEEYTDCHEEFCQDGTILAVNDEANEIIYYLNPFEMLRLSKENITAVMFEVWQQMLKSAQISPSLAQKFGYDLILFENSNICLEYFELLYKQNNIEQYVDSVMNYRVDCLLRSYRIYSEVEKNFKQTGIEKKKGKMEWNN